MGTRGQVGYPYPPETGSGLDSFLQSAGVRTGEVRAKRLLFADNPVPVSIPHPAVGRMPLGDRRNPVAPCLGDGTHTAVVYDNGVEFARSTFKVATLGAEFVTGVSGYFRARDFPDPGVNTLLHWNQNVQGFVIERVEE